MKKVKTYNNFINESLKDRMVGKSTKTIDNVLSTKTTIEKLNLSARNNYVNGIKKILNKFPISEYNEVIYYIEDVLSEAVDSNSYDVIKYLIEDEKVDPNIDHGKALKMSSKYGLYNVVKLLLDNGAIPSIHNSICLSNSCQYGYYDISKLLIEHGADVNADNGYVLYSALRNEEDNRYDIVKLLLDNGADIPIRMLNQVDFLPSKSKEKIIKLFNDTLEERNRNKSKINESLKDKMKGKTDDELDNKFPGYSKLKSFYDELIDDRKKYNLHYLISFITDKKGVFIKMINNTYTYNEYIIFYDEDTNSFKFAKLYRSEFYFTPDNYTIDKVLYNGELNYKMKQVIYNQLDI